MREKMRKVARGSWRSRGAEGEPAKDGVKGREEKIKY